MSHFPASSSAYPRPRRNFALIAFLLTGAGLFGLMGSCCLCGGIFAFTDVEDAPPAPPRVMTCRELEERWGEEGVENVILKEFVVDENYVVQTPSYNEDEFQVAWVPVLPSDGLASREDFRVIVRSRDLNTAASIEQLQQQGEIRGHVTGGIDRGSPAYNLLLQTYPEARVSRAIVIQHNQQPTTPAEERTAFVIAAVLGGLMLLAAIVLAVAAMVMNRR